MHVNSMYECKTPAEFVAWFDAMTKAGDLLGNYPAKSEALIIAVDLLRKATGNTGL